MNDTTHQVDQEKILDKIKKCMALSASSNEHEAAIALRQAQKLMEMHGLTDQAVKAAQAAEKLAKSSARYHPPTWENNLSQTIANAFGCRLVFCSNWAGGQWSYIGCGPAPEIAHYAFTVLLRQVKKARSEHIGQSLKRCKSVTKTRRADLFCEGWVRAAASSLVALTTDTQRTEAIDAYLGLNYPELSTLETKNRNQNKKLTDQDWRHYEAGSELGSKVRINRGMDHGANQTLWIQP